LAPDTGDATGRRHLQGGRPQHEIETELCTIADVFVKINSIKTDPDCEAGCAGGTGMCPDDWYPTGSDECSGACGAVFEPFVSSSAVVASASAMPIVVGTSSNQCARLTHSLHLCAIATNVCESNSGTSAGRCLRQLGWAVWMRWAFFVRRHSTGSTCLAARCCVLSCRVLAVSAQRYIDRITSACTCVCRRPLPCSALPTGLVWPALQPTHL
jgi:hypothetical protein